jgi:hypothetical protein
MFYAGAMVAKTGVDFFAGWASGVGTKLAPGEMPALLFAIVLNGFIFCYLAFWRDVKEWSEGQHRRAPYVTNSLASPPPLSDS